MDEHPERFAPLHAVAAALIDCLASNYDVDVEEGHHVTTGLLHAPSAEETVRAVRLTPRSGACAPRVIVLTSYPALRVHAGTLVREFYPRAAATPATSDGTTSQKNSNGRCSRSSAVVSARKCANHGARDGATTEVAAL